jgi:formate dehydrogenase alpha subunit
LKFDLVLTTCPYCGCGCQFYLEVVDNRVGGIVPCKTDSVSEGKLCIKGRIAHEFVNHKDRLKKPLIRKEGKFIEVEWEEALTLIANKFTEVCRNSGPDSISVLSSAKCTNEENYLAMKFVRAVLGTNNVDHCARLCHASTVVGLVAAFGSGAMTNTVEEFKNADCVLITGSNTLEQHPLIGAKILHAKQKGAKLIVIDPRNVPIAKFADVFLQPKPGTDVAWLNGMMHVILNEGLEDRKFIDERTEGFENFRKVIMKYNPEKVEKITGIPRDKLSEAALVYANAESASIVYSMGITQHTTGTDNVLSIANLAMLTGNVGKELVGVNPLRGQNNVQGACDMGALPNVFSGYQKVSDETIAKKFEQAWGVQLPRTPGLTHVEMMDAAYEGKMKAMYIIGENPMLSEPDINHTRKALEKLDFLVLQDIFPTETTELADVILPGASYAEKEGTFTSTDRKVQRVRMAADPVGDSKPDWWIVCELAKRMGSSQFNFSSPEEVMEELRCLTPIYAGITWRRLDEGEVLRWPCVDSKHPGTEVLHRNKFVRGKGLFHAIEHKDAVELPDDSYPFLLTTGRTIFHYHTGTMTRRTDLLAGEVPTGHMEINPKDAENLGIADDDTVKVESRRGSIKIRATVTDRVAEGVVFIPFHFAECAANMLTSRALDPQAKIPELKVCAVSIKTLGDQVQKG